MCYIGHLFAQKFHFAPVEHAFIEYESMIIQLYGFFSNSTLRRLDVLPKDLVKSQIREILQSLKFDKRIDSSTAVLMDRDPVFWLMLAYAMRDKHDGKVHGIYYAEPALRIWLISPRQNFHYFADDIFLCMSVSEKF